MSVLLCLSFGSKVYVLNTGDLLNFKFCLCVGITVQKGRGELLNGVSPCEFRSGGASLTKGFFIFLFFFPVNGEAKLPIRN